MYEENFDSSGDNFQKDANLDDSVEKNGNFENSAKKSDLFGDLPTPITNKNTISRSMSTFNDTSLFREDFDSKLEEKTEKEPSDPSKSKKYSEKTAINEFLSSTRGMEKLLDLAQSFNTQYFNKPSKKNISGKSNGKLTNKTQEIDLLDFIPAILDVYDNWLDGCSMKSAWGNDLYSAIKKIEETVQKERGKYTFLFKN